MTFNLSGATLTQNNRPTDTFERLFGDIDGNATVNTTDKTSFNLAFGQIRRSTNYQFAFDLNADGTINTTDKTKFNLNFGKSFSGFTATV